jgi:hypothetical protein
MTQNETRQEATKVQENQSGDPIRSRLHREGREFESLAAYHSTQREPCHLPLLQKPQKSLTSPGIQFLGIQRTVIIPVGGFEALLDDGKIFLL